MIFIINAHFQFSSATQSCPTFQDPMNRSTPGLPVHYQIPEFTKLMCIESVKPSIHLILYRPLLLLSPILPSIRVFSNQSTLRRRWPKYWSFSFSISPSKEHLIVREMQIKTTMKYHLTLFKWTTIKKSTHNKCWRECGKKETFLHSWWECKLVQPLENSVELPCGPAIPFLGT